MKRETILQKAGLAAAGLTAGSIVIFLAWAFGSMHKYDLLMYQHNVHVFFEGGDLYRDPRNFVPPPAIIALIPLAWAGKSVKLFQTIFTLAVVFGAIVTLTGRWGGRKRAPWLLAGSIVSFPFVDTMSQGHLGGWALLGFVLAWVAATMRPTWRQAAVASAGFALLLVKPQVGMFTALALLLVVPWPSRLTILATYAGQWIWVSAATGGVTATTVRWVEQLLGHAQKYPNLMHDVSIKSIIRNFIGPPYQGWAWVASAAVLIAWLVLARRWRKNSLAAPLFLTASLPFGYWFSPYFSNYDLLAIGVVIFVWLAIHHPRLALGGYLLHITHWFWFMQRDYGPGIVQAAPGWVALTVLAVVLMVMAKNNYRKPLDRKR